MAVVHELAAQASRWHYGYDLCRVLDLKAGTVYPILIRLADRGLVETAWEQSPPQGRPPRHLYRLSAAGAEFAKAVGTTSPAARNATTDIGPMPRPATGSVAP